MTSSARHKQCRAYIELAKSNIMQLKFQDAAFEILRANDIAEYVTDKMECYLMRRELVDEHGVNWENTKRTFSLTTLRL